jgi:Tfp pilus tip-associated adhesin PilY1
MLNKKSLLAVAVIINIIITVFSSMNVWADDAPAGDEQKTFSNTLPDALILLDLSGSMANNPAGTAYPYGADTSCVGNTTKCNNPTDTTYVYSYDNTCTPDTVNCHGTGNTTYTYAHDGSCTADTVNCVGTYGSNYKYAADSSCKPNTSKCTGSRSGTSCSGGYCNGTGISACTTDCSKFSCSGGFCQYYSSSSPHTPSGCATLCNCQNGLCQGSVTNCTNQCATNKCDMVNGFCNDTSQSDCSTDCSKLGIAKRALFDILDDDNSGTIDANDAISLGIRLGFMRYYNGDDTSGDYTSGNNKLVDVISTITGGVSSQNQTSYQLIYCGNSTSCASTVTSCGTGATECIVGETASGGTPLASALKEAKTYLDTHKAGDAYSACRQKFVILLTDGDDTYACSGSGGECQSKMYARRREVVAASKQLNDAGYKVFVIGFGSQMPLYLQNTLNWMAWYGGTDNPLLTNSGSKTQYNISLGCNNTPAVTSACCNLTTNASACYPSGLYGSPASGVSSCSTDSSTITNSDCGSSQSGFQATYNDPGYLALSGYAFLAGDSAALTSSLKSAINTIKASVQATRTIDENYLYEASFEPIYNDPFWIGHLKRFGINNDGTVHATSDWDAGQVLKNTAASNRNIYTTDPLSASGVLKTFTTANLTNAILAVTTDAARNSIVNFIRGGELAASYSFYGWKLGDILHAAPLSIPTPNANFYDTNDTSSPTAYKTFMTNHPRTSANGKRIIIIGANDGQLHAIKAGDLSGTTGGGSELWSFVPPNFLPKLQNIAHSSHPTELIHGYFVDGPLSAADIWLGTGGTIGATAKSVSDWHTYLISSEGRGGITTLWSSSSSCSCLTSASDCSTVFSSSYSSTYNKYCGYYAFDTTDTSTVPTIKWTLGGTSGLSSTDGTYLGQPWSKMAIGRVRISNAEKWLGMIGGGCAGTNCSSVAPTDMRGKGFYVVDLSNGNILWRYTYNNNTNMVYNIPAGPGAVDFDGDGFLDTAYVGDTGGNMWRFKFCLRGDDTTASPCACTSSSCPKWSGGLLFSKPSTTLSIFTSASVAFDPSQNLWVYFGTGDKANPTSTTTQDRFYAIQDSKDGSRSTTYQLSDLTDITSLSQYDVTSGKHGWYINLQGTGEKLLAAPVVYDKKVYFTTYTPSVTPCDQNGIAKLYVVDYVTAKGECAGGARSVNVGTGVPSGAVISVNPYGGYDTYISTSSPILETVGSAHTFKETDPSTVFQKSKNIIYWRDNRVQ